MNEHLVQLLLTHAQIVFKYLRKIGASKEDAEDVVQEAIVKTIEYIDQVQLDSMRAWLFKVALHRYYTLYKKQKIVNMLIISRLLPAFLTCFHHGRTKVRFLAIFQSPESVRHDIFVIGKICVPDILLSWTAVCLILVCMASVPFRFPFCG